MTVLSKSLAVVIAAGMPAAPLLMAPAAGSHTLHEIEAVNLKHAIRSTSNGREIPSRKQQAGGLLASGVDASPTGNKSHLQHGLKAAKTDGWLTDRDPANPNEHWRAGARTQITGSARSARRAGGSSTKSKKLDNQQQMTRGQRREYKRNQLNKLKNKATSKAKTKADTKGLGVDETETESYSGRTSEVDAVTEKTNEKPRGTSVDYPEQYYRFGRTRRSGLDTAFKNGKPKNPISIDDAADPRGGGLADFMSEAERTYPEMRAAVGDGEADKMVEAVVANALLALGLEAEAQASEDPKKGVVANSRDASSGRKTEDEVVKDLSQPLASLIGEILNYRLTVTRTEDEKYQLLNELEALGVWINKLEKEQKIESSEKHDVEMKIGCAKADLILPPRLVHDSKTVTEHKLEQKVDEQAIQSFKDKLHDSEAIQSFKDKLHEMKSKIRSRSNGRLLFEEQEYLDKVKGAFRDLIQNSKLSDAEKKRHEIEAGVMMRMLFDQDFSFGTQVQELVNTHVQPHGGSVKSLLRAPVVKGSN